MGILYLALAVGFVFIVVAYTVLGIMMVGDLQCIENIDTSEKTRNHSQETKDRYVQSKKISLRKNLCVRGTLSLIAVGILSFFAYVNVIDTRNYVILLAVLCSCLSAADFCFSRKV